MSERGCEAAIVYVTDVLATGDEATGVPIPDEVNVAAEYPELCQEFEMEIAKFVADHREGSSVKDWVTPDADALEQLLGTAAAIALFFAIELTLGTGNVVRASLRFPLAMAATWWVVATHGWWFQAVRPEVYALQAALPTETPRPDDAPRRHGSTSKP